jgi:hypothetical protein
MGFRLKLSHSYHNVAKLGCIIVPFFSYTHYQRWMNRDCMTIDYHILWEGNGESKIV